MSERLRTMIALAVIGASLAAVVAILAWDDGGPGNRVDALAVRLKCPVCTSESVADSPAQVSRDLYELIAEQVEQGWTDDEVIDFFVARYGDEVLLDPPATGSTSVLWIAPLAILAIGATVIGGRHAGSDRPLSDDDRDAVRRALEERR